jgi:uncharacterized protein
MTKLERLAAYIEAVANQDSAVKTYKEFERDILSVQADELFDLFYQRLQQNEKAETILTYLDKLMHVFYQSLKHRMVDLPKDSFLDHLDQENQQLAKRLESIKEVLIENDLSLIQEVLLSKFQELLLFNDHYVKKENILFPYLELKDDKYKGLSIMWSLHDQTRQSLNDVIKQLLQKPYEETALKQAIGRYFFNAYGLIQKEESILFVVAMDLCSQHEFEHMREQSFDYNFCFIKTPEFKQVTRVHVPSDQWLFQTDTGHLTHQQLLMFINTLPLDCTIIDENNKVVFFNRPTERLFPRSPAIIGRDVRNCHPADSVDIVNQIIDAFRENKKDVATFWIDFKGRKLLIQYFALRDESNVYKGTIEVSQDITDIQQIKGQRRLLDWD